MNDTTNALHGGTPAGESRTALIVFAHGARDPDWAAPVMQTCATIRKAAPQLRVEAAFLDFIAPDLTACASRLLDAGFERIVILPLFIARGGHLKNDLPRLVADLQQKHPHAVFLLAPPTGETDAIISAVAAHAVQLCATGQAGQCHRI